MGSGGASGLRPLGRLRILAIGWQFGFKVVGFLIKFPPKQEVNGKVTNLVVTHRQVGITNTFVIAGEHHVYEPDGTPCEVWPVGNITVGKSGDMRKECGGPDGGRMRGAVT